MKMMTEMINAFTYKLLKLFLFIERTIYSQPIAHSIAAAPVETIRGDGSLPCSETNIKQSYYFFNCCTTPIDPSSIHYASNLSI